MSADGSDLPCINLSEHEGVRFLHLDSVWVQGAMRVRKPFELELEYIQRMMAWMILVDLDSLESKKAVQLGLGAAALTKYFHHVLKWNTTAVEINPMVISACRNWFKLPPNDDTLNVVEMDAKQWLESHAARSEKSDVDVLCVDLYDQDAESPVYDDAEFYAHCKSLLGHSGIMSVNLFGRHASFQHSAKQLLQVFDEGCLWSMQPTREGNTILLGTRHAVEWPDRQVLLDRAEVIEATWKLPARKWIKMLKPFELK